MSVKEKKSILIIDDDSKLLDGLKRLMRSKNNEWHVNFEIGGKNAIEYIKNNKIDLLVTDMKMPEFNGYEVLKFAASNQPQCLRFILSGQADKSDILKIAPLANQFIQKPCSVEQIISKIEQALNVIDTLKFNDILFSKDTIDLILEGIHSNSFICYEKNIIALRKLLKLNDIIDDKIVNMILKDIGITNKIMQLYISDFYDNSNKEFNLKQAINSIGKDELVQIINNNGIFPIANKNEEKVLDIIHKSYNSNPDLANKDKTLLALSLSASTMKRFNDINADQKSLNSLSFNICSLWGIDIKKLIKSFSESKNIKELKGNNE